MREIPGYENLETLNLFGCFADGSAHYFDKGHFPKWFSW